MFKLWFIINGDNYLIIAITNDIDAILRHNYVFPALSTSPEELPGGFLSLSGTSSQTLPLKQRGDGKFFENGTTRFMGIFYYMGFMGYP
jgi:hypothetical protein